MKALETRLDRPDPIALAELKRLRPLNRLSHSPKEICLFASRIVNIVIALQALNKAHDLYNPEITKLTIEKLMPAMKYRECNYAAEQPKEEADKRNRSHVPHALKGDTL